MTLPFGVQLKGLVVGILLAMFVWPWVSGKFMSARTSE